MAQINSVFSHLEPACIAYPMKLCPPSASHRQHKPGNYQDPKWLCFQSPLTHSLATVLSTTG